MCANMLYVKQHPNDSARLLFYCKNCQFTKEHDSDAPYILSQKTMDTSSYSMFIHPYIQNDPTLPHVNTLPCPSPNCTRPTDAEQDVVYMKYDYENMDYVYSCSHCGHFWTTEHVRRPPAAAAVSDIKKNETTK